jgi:hypothetical protein
MSQLPSRRFKAFSSEVETGSREENASNKIRPGFDAIKAGCKAT